MIYEVTQYEIHFQRYRVDAKSEAEAVQKVLDGDGSLIPSTSEESYLESAEDLGMSADDNKELADELRELGIAVGDIIPTIRSVEQVN